MRGKHIASFFKLNLFYISVGSLDDATPVPPTLVAKYNRFVDSILGRINKILSRSYDPVNVHLATFDAKNNKGKNKKRY